MLFTNKMKRIKASMVMMIILTIMLRVVRSKEYEYLSYDQIIERLVELNKNDKNNVFDVTFGPSGFPGVYPIKCMSTSQTNKNVDCQFPVIRVTNFNKTSNEINKLPQVVIVSGVYGTERIGPSAILGLLSDIEDNIDYYKPTIDRLMIIFAPVSNPAGFSEDKLGENGANPMTDFPLFYSETKSMQCMSTSSARFINSIFRDNLISGAFVFSLSSTDLTKISIFRVITKVSPS